MKKETREWMGDVVFIKGDTQAHGALSDGTRVVGVYKRLDEDTIIFSLYKKKVGE